jgi:CBS domain-containing protein
MLTGVEHLSAHRLFKRRLLEETLTRRPPTGFFKEFVVEANGEHRGELDLKGLGLWPVIAIGRWIAVSTRMSVTTTAQRLERGEQSGLLSRDETMTLSGAYKLMFELLFAREIDAVRQGSPATTYIDPKELDTFTRSQLREAFRAIAKVQGRLSSELL